jgi:RimJ/RimL family protein N-acetyltransferase
MFSTRRLLLRGWLAEDFGPFAAMNADPEVMRYFPKTLNEAETGALMQRIGAHFERHGFGLWAVELRDSGEFAGFIGLSVPRFEAHFTPCVEIGWRLAARHWNQGLATEGASAVLNFGIESLGLREIVSFTAAENAASRRVMEKIGMRRDEADDFEHPEIPEGHVLRRHVLYKTNSAC